MAKPLKDIVKNRSTKVKNDLGGYKPKSGDEQDFVAKHEIEKHSDRNGNDDDVFNATNVKHALKDPDEDKHGYAAPEDEKVNEGMDCNKSSAKIYCPLHGKEECPADAKEENEIEEGMNASTIKHKQKLSYMKPDELHGYFKSVMKANPFHKSMEKVARSVAWRHGYGKESGHYWNQIKHLETKNEEVEQVDEVSSALIKRAAIASAKKDVSNWAQIGHSDRTKRLSKAYTKKADDERKAAGQGFSSSVKEGVELDEKHLTSAEMKKREEVAKAIERDNPDMPMGKKMAIATATAKKVAESTDSIVKNAISEARTRTLASFKSDKKKVGK